MSVTKYLLLTFFCACALSAISQRKNISGSLYISRLSRLNFKCGLLVYITQYFQSVQQALLSGFREKKNRGTRKIGVFGFGRVQKNGTRAPLPTLFPRSLLRKRLLRSTDNLVTVFSFFLFFSYVKSIVFSYFWLAVQSHKCTLQLIKGNCKSKSYTYVFYRLSVKKYSRASRNSRRSLAIYFSTISTAVVLQLTDALASMSWRSLKFLVSTISSLKRL